ncbi:ribosome 60S biogenesis N-terminal-domain-containing protein [Flammula alnicola]|nr:ribosome 60S biogenesis N-terminal-domain-containing protein [Flammula alnicola]
MPAKEYPHKRPRIEATTKSKFYADPSEIRLALRTDSPDGLAEALTALRNQLTLKAQEPSVLPQDERLNLAKQWMQSSPGAHDLFSVWDNANPRSSSLISLVLSVLSSILSLLSSHYTDHALGQPIMKVLVTPSRLRQLNSYIGGSHNELIIVTLKLFNVMSNFAGGRDRKIVLEGFGWEIKSLPKLLNMRRKTHGETDTTDPLLRPDIRTLYILLLLSFVDVDNPTQTKTTFLEQHREPFLAIFKGLLNDHYTLARKVLEVCWAGIWSDAKLKRTLKVGLFNETTLGHLFKLYDRTQSDDDDDDHIPANLVHHFLLAICTRAGAGICFKDRAWYPRETDADDLVPKDEYDNKRSSGKIYNKILANVLKTLKVNEDSRQQELAIKILSACPELVAGYWSAAALTLEPRLSSKWIANIAVFGNIISLPVPSSSFYMPNSQLYQPTPPPLSTVIENILPSVGTKNNFSKGLQSPSGLVQHCTALALSRCLDKYRAIDEQFRTIAAALEEDEEEGQWYKRCRELEREVRRRVPEFQVVVGFSQQKHTSVQGQVNQTKVALLAESAQRLLWLYHRCLPAVVAEARFDVGKLLQTFAQGQNSGQDIYDGEEESPDAAPRLYRVQQLHVLSLLKDSGQFVWTGKIASLPHTPFHILLTALTSSTIPAIRAALSTLLQHILSQSILFQEDPHEPDLWLKALPKRRAACAGAYTPTFPGEAEGVISFVDDCVQRCLKTPYRYVEALHALGHHSNTNPDVIERLDMYPSPLLMTVIEQLDAKINNKSLGSGHLVGVISFVRKLLVNLASKTSDLHFLRTYAHKIDEILLEERLSQTSPTFFTAVRREVDILYASLSFSSFGPPITTSGTPEMGAYIAIAEQAPIPESNRQRTVAASQLVDWMRTLSQPLGLVELRRLIVLVTTLDPSMLPSIVENLIPGQTDVWAALDLASAFSEYCRSFKFQWIYLHSGLQEIVNEHDQIVLSNSVFVQRPTLVDVTRAVYLVMHAVSAARQQDEVLKGHISLLARILKAASAVLSSSDLNTIQEVIFVQPGILKDIMMSPSSSDVLESIELVLESTVKPSSESDCKLVSGISDHWFNVLKTGLGHQAPASVSTGCIWIKYLEPSQLFELLDFLEKDARNMAAVSVLQPINTVLEALCSTASFESQGEWALVQRLPQLISLNSIMSDSPLLEKVIAVAIEASLPVGLDGCPPAVLPSSSSDLLVVVRRAEGRWSQRGHPLKIDIDIRSFLTRDTFSESTAKIISGLLYRQTSCRQIVAEWLNSEHCLQRSAQHLLPIIDAFLDSSSDGSTTSTIRNETCLLLMPKIIQTIADKDVPSILRIRAQHCLLNALAASTADPSELLDAIAKELNALSQPLSRELISGGRKLVRKFGSKAHVVVSILVDRGMQWCIDRFAEERETLESKQVTEDLTSLIKEASISKAHLVETLLSVVIQNRFSSVESLHLAVACLSTTQLKPLIVNRHLQSIIQHSYFFKICASSSPESFKIRDAVVELLHCLFNLHPNNTCQITHIEPLIRIYRGTLSTSDLRILSIFQLFESQRKLSVTTLLSRWSSTPNTLSQTTLEALQSLDPIVVLRTCLNFPRWRRVEDQSALNADAQEAALYDPVFLMLLFSQMLSDEPPTSAFGWIELFRTNVASLFIRTLSSKDGQMRDLALCQIIGLWKQMETADLQEKPHVLYILNLLKDLMPTPTIGEASENARRLPTYTTLLLMHALRAIFSPSNFIYPLTARFLLQRPSLDIADVPMLYGMLYSSSDENWKKERGWMVKFLADGMMGSEDWCVLKRRHTWDLLASLFQSADGVEDKALRMGVLEVLANLTCNAQATMSLILKSALLPWIEMQLLHSNSKAEGVEWIKILENIVVIVDSNKVEASTNGEWRTIISRCIALLLDDETCPSTAENFLHAVPVILRLASLSGPALASLPSLLDLAVKCLEQVESTVHLDSYSSPQEVLNFMSSPPHHALTLHQRLLPSQSPTPSLSRQVLVRVIGMLWRASMSVDRGCAAWEKLTPRVLLWRSLAGEQSGMIDASLGSAEWARKEVVVNLSKVG